MKKNAREYGTWIGLSFLIFLYLTFYGMICFLKYHSFSYHDFDLAHHAQTLWNLCHGSWQCSILGIPFLGNHAHWILFLLVPFYKVWSSPLLLLFLQTGALGLGAWPFFLVAQKWVGNRASLFFVAMYLLYPALGYANLFEFHPPVFATFFIFWTAWAYFEKKFWIYHLFLILACLCQENILLGSILWGLYALFQKRGWRWFVFSVLWGVLGFWISTQGVMTSLNGGKVGFENLYLHLGRNLAEVLSAFFLKPNEVLKFFFQTDHLKFLVQLFAPLFFLSFLSPSILFLALPFFLQHLLSARIQEHSIYYHYTLEVIPFIFLSAVAGFSKIQRLNFFKKKWVLFILGGMGALFYESVSGPLLPTLSQAHLLKRDELDQVRESLVSQVKNQSVMATFEFLSHLANRRELYSFHHLYSGKYTLSDHAYEIPSHLDALLVDFTDPLTFGSFDSPQGGRRLRSFLKGGGWQADRVIENMVLFRPHVIHPINLFREWPKVEISEKPIAIFNRNLECLRVEFEKNVVARGETLQISFLWRALKKIPEDDYLCLFLSDASGHEIWQVIHPFCYRMDPTFDWSEGEIVQENLFLLIPQGALPGRYVLTGFVFDRRDRKILKVEAEPRRKKKGNRVFWGTFSIDRSCI
ncbi:MAG: DUF2079 domain-containing protein [Chlamydiae bacterium]|nr:DUF2079 domain-containing protein [Chlamydiota bacterium]MBI3265501.1 DUF2079 domain-containing protein [Chlamydiota bacterium]